MFFLKKLISAVLYPVPLCLLLLLVGVVMLWIGKTKTWGRRMTTVGLVLLLLFSFEVIPHGAVRTLEDDYPVFAPSHHPDVAVQWVVVLSGGIRDEPSLPPNDQLTVFALARLVEGIRVLAHYPEARLLVTGKGYFSTLPEAVAMQQTALLLGVDSTRIRLEDQSIDTAEQAVNVRAIVGGDPFVLVTSAVHMPRAMALFEKQGLTPLPAPAPHLIRPNARTHLGSFFPSSGNLYLLKLAWHEYLGLLWGRLTNRA
jgi:uncharacterized SAM-binding protein YcdF (DUF218 family)